MWGLIDTTHLLIVFLIFVPLEQLIPLHPEQKHFRRQWFNDIVYILFNDVVIKIGLLLTVGLTMVGIKSIWPEGMLPFVATMPLWLQTLLALVIADLGFYFAHRAAHEIPWLWRFHAVHHSIEEMDCIAAHRVHPVDQVLTRTAALLPVYALGFSFEAIVAITVLYQLQSLLNHANARVDFGRLGFLVASPRFHHWHHANEKEAFDKNYAAQISLIDWVFGTMYMPDRMPSKYGIDEKVPETYHEQLVYPFTAKTAETAGQSAPVPAAQ